MSSQNNPESQTSGGLSQLAGKYLTFALAKEKYALQILKVQEIIGMMHITQVPKTTAHLKGVINLRGKIIPIVNLRLKFGMSEIPYDEKTCIIVVQVQSGGKTLSVGVIVDTVLEVLNFEASKLEPAPDYGVNVNTNFLMAMGRVADDDVVIIIDIDRALVDASLSAAVQSGAATQPTAS